jgi:hypothetical protein
MNALARGIPNTRGLSSRASDVGISEIAGVADLPGWHQWSDGSINAM